MAEIRLQKYLADSGIASRRKAEELIKSGVVSVNGKVVTEMGFKVTEKDVVEVTGRRASIESDKVYIMLNKPVGYVSTVKDQFGRPSVIDLVKDVRARVYPVGRLDYDTSGLILLTNDGDFTYKLTHPKHEIDKTYRALIKGIPSQEEVMMFEKGLRIEDFITAPASFKIIKTTNNNSTVEITIHEGKNRQVRKMCDEINHPVIELERISIGRLELGDLKEGMWRFLSEDEVCMLRG